MATIIKCDGCDKRLAEGSKPFKVEITQPGAVISGWDKPRFFDLCSRCLDQMLRDANPAQWPRAEKPTLSPEPHQ